MIAVWLTCVKTETAVKYKLFNDFKRIIPLYSEDKSSVFVQRFQRFLKGREEISSRNPLLGNPPVGLFRARCDSLPAGRDRKNNRTAREVTVETRAARLQEMEEMAAEMLATAHKLPPSQERHEILSEIEKMRARIDGLKAKSKT
jgi:hypothetical protein